MDHELPGNAQAAHQDHALPLEAEALSPPGFEFSPERPPSVEELREHVFLVHLTSRIPENDIVHAAATDQSRDQRWQGQTPPSYRPTLHTSMNESFKSEDPSGFSRDHIQTAVILPLRSIEPQVASIFPNDTVLVGDVSLDASSTIVLPVGAAYGGTAKVVRYNPEGTPLSDVVDGVIAESGGWPMQTHMFLDGPHSFASESQVNDINITGRSFFDAFLQQHPEVSYGSHFHSEVGEAWRSGLADYLIATTIKAYSDTMQNQIPTDELIMRRELIVRSAATFERSIMEGNYSDSVRQVVHEAGEQLQQWLNLIDADLYARQQHGRTLTDVRGQAQRDILEARNDVQKLRQTVDAQLDQLRPAFKLQPDLEEMGSMVGSMSLAEYQQFTGQFAEITSQHGTTMDVTYAITRWMLIGTERAQTEGIDGFLQKSLLDTNDETRQVAQWNLRLYQRPNCGRQKTAADIARALDMPHSDE